MRVIAINLQSVGIFRKGQCNISNRLFFCGNRCDVFSHTENFAFSCSSADETEEGELDPDIKAQREKERRQANNARERCAFVLLKS